MSKPRVIYWFRTDLRLHDSPALKAALDLKPECLYPIWCWDPHYVYRARVGPNRFRYLYGLPEKTPALPTPLLTFQPSIDCQNDLSASLTKLNPKSKLFLIREGPTTLLPKLFKAWRISHLVFEKDTDAYAKERDGQVMKLAREAGVEVITRCGRTLYDSDELVKANGGKPTMSITQVQRVSNMSVKMLAVQRIIRSRQVQRSATSLVPSRHHCQFQIQARRRLILTKSNRRKSPTSMPFREMQKRLHMRISQDLMVILPYRRWKNLVSNLRQHCIAGAKVLR